VFVKCVFVLLLLLLLLLALPLLLLQGQIGKFGSLELTDVSAFVELPDGKVLSSSESGALLLWEGGLIKVVICQPAGQPCHAGAVEVLLHSTEVNYILSGGADGVLRLWDFNKINEAEPKEMAVSCGSVPQWRWPCPTGVMSEPACGPSGPGWCWWTVDGSCRSAADAAITYGKHTGCPTQQVSATCWHHAKALLNSISEEVLNMAARVPPLDAGAWCTCCFAGKSAHQHAGCQRLQC